MGNILIDRTPPVPTGNAAEDIKAQYEYLCYLQETLNFILRQIYKAQQ